MSSFLRISLAGFLVFLFGAGFLLAQSGSPVEPPAVFPERTTPSEEPKYKVYVPSNEKGEPQGDKYYISSGLLNELRKASLERQSLQNRWSILEAKYQATFSVVSTGAAPGIVVSQFKATFEIELESATGESINTTLVLPVLPLQADGAKWDKHPVQPIFVSKNKEKNAAGNSNVPRPTDSSPAASSGGSQGSPDHASINQPSGSQSPPRRSEHPDAEHLVFQLEHQTPGKHTLELMLTPIVEQVPTTATGRRIVLPEIPKVTNAVLELNLSPDMPSVLAEEALGPTTQAPGTAITKLGPIDKLTLSWNDPSAQANEPRVECEQFFLLNARLNHISVNALYKFRITGGKVQQLEIAADERMVSVGDPIFEGNPNATLLLSYPNTPTPGMTTLHFKEPISGPLTIRVNYGISKFSGIGVLRFPQIPRSRHRVLKSYLGITSVPALDLTLPSPPTTSDLKTNTDQFKLDWGEEINEILLATYDLTAIDQTWQLSIRAKNPDVEGKLRHSILFRNNRANHAVDVQLDSSGPVYTYSFVIPEDFSIEKVEARVSDSPNQEPDPVPIHWRLRTPDVSYPDSTKRKILSIFFERPLRNKHEISFRAFCPFRIDTSEAIPSVGLNHVNLSEYSVDLFREKSVVLKEQAISANWSPVELAEAPKDPFNGIHFGRWVFARTIAADFKPDSPADESRIVLTANIPLVVGEQYTYLNRNVEIERFNVVSLFELDIQEGELNSLRLRYDKLCALPSSSEPAMSIEEAMEEGERFLVLTPHQPLHGKQKLRLNAVMNSSMDSTVFPKIDLTESFQIKRYVILPSDVKAQPIKWEKNQLAPVSPDEAKAIFEKIKLTSLADQEHEGVNEKETTASSFSVADVFELRQREEAKASQAPAPESAAATSTVPHTSEKFEVLHVLGPDFSAYINQTENIPTVQLNDVHLFLRQNGTVSGVSSFDIRGEGTDHCVLYLPEPYELVSITSGGLTTKGVPISARRWRFDIWSSQFPQRVEVVFSGSLADKDDFEALPNGLQSDTRQRQAKAKKSSWERLLSPLTRTSSHSLNDDVLPLFRSKGLASLQIELPRLESTHVLGTIWTLAIENSPLTQQTLFYVDQEQNDTWDPKELLQQGKPLWSLLLKEKDEDDSQTETDPSNSKDKKNEKTAILPLTPRDSASCILQVNLIRLANMGSLMGGVSGTGASSESEDLLNWHSLWGRKWWEVHREINTLLLVYKSNPGIPWETTLFQGGDMLPEYMRQVVGVAQKPESLFQEISANYSNSVAQVLPLQGHELENDITESSVFAAYRLSRSENISYLFGVSNRADLSLQIYSIPKQPGIAAALFENDVIRITSIVIFVFGLILLANRLHPIRFFRQYPYFVGNVIAILLWLFFPPGFVGLTLLPILWFAMFWSGWKRRSRGRVWGIGDGG